LHPQAEAKDQSSLTSDVGGERHDMSTAIQT